MTNPSLDGDKSTNTVDAETAAAAPTSMSTRVTLVLAAIVIPTALALGAYVLVRHGTSSPKASRVPGRFQLQLEQQFDIPQDMIGYVQQSSFPLELREPRALTVATDGRIYVAGDQAIEILQPNGKAVRQIKLEIEPTCVAVASDDSAEAGRIYIGTSQGVLIYGPDGSPQGAWPALDEKSELTAIAITPEDVFVADAGHRVVLRYDSDGHLLGRIGAPSPDRQMPGFVIPSPYFDLVLAPDMFLYVVNPGARRIECYTFDGQLQGYWGRAGSSLADFFGCCNPAHLACLPDGRFVTSEKGIPRIKVYSALGDFETVVAGPAQLSIPNAALGDARGGQVPRVFDIATNQQGAVLALDPQQRCIRVFVPKPNSVAPAKTTKKATTEPTSHE